MYCCYCNKEITTYIIDNYCDTTCKYRDEKIKVYNDIKNILESFNDTIVNIYNVLRYPRSL